MYEEEATTARLGIILNFIGIDEYCVILNMSCRYRGMGVAEGCREQLNPLLVLSGINIAYVVTC